MTKSTDMLDELIKEHLAQGKHPKELLAEGGLLKQLTKAIVERCLEGEMEDHLGYEKGERAGKGGENRRNGYSKKTLTTEQGDINLGIPRDRNAEFEPQVVSKRQTRLEGFDDKILAMYARGMTVRDIQAQLKEIYGTEVSPTLISNVTDGVLEEVKAWQSRPLENLYPIVFFDALVVKVRENQRVINKAVYLALAVNTNGQKELLGIWISQNEGAKFWLGILTELKNRGVQDILIACVDGLTGLQKSQTKSLSGHVFLTKHGQPYAKHVDREWRMALKKAGLRHRPAYQLRHTFASLCLQQGLQPTWVAKVLGHASPQITFKHYARWINDGSEINEQRLENFLAEQMKSGPNLVTRDKNSSPRQSRKP